MHASAPFPDCSDFVPGFTIEGGHATIGRLWTPGSVADFITIVRVFPYVSFPDVPFSLGRALVLYPISSLAAARSSYVSRFGTSLNV